MLDKAKTICKKNGVEFNFIPSFNPNRLSLFWYGGNIITLKYQDKELVISAVGDVVFTIFDETVSKDIYIYRNKNNSGVDDSILEELIPDDETMKKFMENLRVYWHYNNWIEFSIYQNDEKICHITDSETTSIDEILDDIFYYIDLLKTN